MPSSQFVHVIDDDTDVRQSLTFLLSTAGYAVRAHPSAVAFLEHLPNAEDGCIVTDVRMPGMDGLELQRQLKKAKSTMPVIVITGHGDVGLAVDAMKAGALDFIEKPFDDEALLAAIKSALQRRDSDRQRSMAASEIAARIKLLSDRERQVMEGLVAGKPNKIIAYELGIAETTVKAHVTLILRKLGVFSRTQAVLAVRDFFA